MVAKDGRLPRKIYERELVRLQAELVTMQEWVRAEGIRLVVVFEGRDAAGKGSTIKRVTEYLKPPKLRLPHLPPSTGYVRPPRELQTYVPDHSSTIL